MRADINCGARWFVGKVDNEVLGRIACGRQSFALRKPLEEVERGGFRRTVAFARDAFTIARARRYVVKKLRGQRATRCAVHVSPDAPRPQLQRARRICQAWSDAAGACRPACCGFGFLEGCDIGFWSSQRPSLAPRQIPSGGRRSPAAGLKIAYRLAATRCAAVRPAACTLCDSTVTLGGVHAV